MRDQELILRFFALLHASESYTKPMKEFLNRFMVKHRFLDAELAQVLRRSLEDTIAAIHAGFGERALELATEGRLKDAVDSVVSNRHQIAHGRSVGLTFVTIQGYYAGVVEVIDLIESVAS